MSARSKLALIVGVVYATGASVVTSTPLDTIALGLIGGWLWGGLDGDLKRQVAK